MLIPPNWIGDRSLRASLISRPVHVRDTFITTSVHPRAKILLSQGDRPYIRIRSQTLVESLLKPHRWEWFQKNWWQLITYLSKVRHFNIRAYWLIPCAPGITVFVLCQESWKKNMLLPERWHFLSRRFPFDSRVESTICYVRVWQPIFAYWHIKMEKEMIIWFPTSRSCWSSLITF